MIRVTLLTTGVFNKNLYCDIGKHMYLWQYASRYWQPESSITICIALSATRCFNKNLCCAVGDIWITIYVVPLANVCSDNDLCHYVDKIRSCSNKYLLEINFLKSTYPKLVFTVNQNIVLYEDNDQMSLPQATRLQLVNEGLENVHNFLEFDVELIKGIDDNLRFDDL